MNDLLMTGSRTLGILGATGINFSLWLTPSAFAAIDNPIYGILTSTQLMELQSSLKLPVVGFRQSILRAAISLASRLEVLSLIRKNSTI